MRQINWWYVGNRAVLVLNILAGLSDFLQGGPAWPVNVCAAALLIVVRL